MGGKPPRPPPASRLRPPASAGIGSRIDPASPHTLPPWTGVAGALAITFAAYIASMTAGYVWDDEALVLLNRALSHPTWRTLLASDLWCCSGTTTSGYWRPITTLSFFTDVALFGYVPAWAHLHSLLWHLACTALVGALVHQRHGWIRAGIAALIFGLHPIQSEAVVWIAARNDLLATTFAVGAMLSVDRGRAWFAVGCATMAALSKESSFLLPLLAVLWVWAHDGVGGVMARWRALVGAACGLGLALAARQYVNLGRAAEFQRVPLEDPFASLHGVVRLLGWLVWPWPLTGTATLYLPRPGPEVWISAGIAVLLAILAIRAAPRRGTGLVAMLLVSALPMAAALTVFATLGERYLYLPMIGVAALVATSVPLGRTSAAVLTTWALGALLAIHVRLPDWINNLTFFHAAAMRAPDSFSWDLYGAELVRRDQHEAGVAALERSLAARPARRFACTRIAGAAKAVMSAEALKARLPDWRAAGCADLPAFEFQVAWSLSVLGDEPGALAALSLAHGEHSGVRSALSASIALRDGDLWTAAATLAADPEAPEARARLGTLRALRR